MYINFNKMAERTLSVNIHGSEVNVGERKC